VYRMVCATLLSLVIGLLAVLLAYRKLRQARIASTLRLENPHAILEERFVSIGGIDQWISIRGEDQSNPVLLVIHGGPGSCYSIFTPHLRAWEKHFTIVQWDQRGAGRTFGRMKSRSRGQLSLERLACDGIAVAEYLRARLRKDKLFLLASSLGSTFGMQIARSRPEMFHAYIGTDQNVGMSRGRDELHRQLLERLRTHGLTKGVRAIARIGADPALWTPDDFSAVAQWTMKSDPAGFQRTVKLLKGAVWYAPGWKLSDIRTFVAGMRFSLEQLLPEIVRYDPWAHGTRFSLPIFIFQGEDDVLTTPAAAKAFFADIVAPAKQMELISGAGHFAAFLQPDLFLQKLLSEVRPLATDVVPASFQ
jgi:pimeloyl-ACP methyl ester carboxylesterase